MLDYEEILEYKLLNQLLSKVRCIRLYAEVGFMQFGTVWLNIANYYGKYYLNLDFLQRRQLFFEVVLFALENKYIKFSCNKNYYEKKIALSEDATNKEILIYLEKGFSLREEVMDDTSSKIPIDALDDSYNLDLDHYSYFLNYCPNIAYWDIRNKEWYWYW